MRKQRPVRHAHIAKKTLDPVEEFGQPFLIESYRQIAPSEARARMDLVALEKVGDGWKIVFWEAKLVTNPGARCRGDAPPKVIRQLARYIHRLRHADPCNNVA